MRSRNMFRIACALAFLAASAAIAKAEAAPDPLASYLDSADSSYSWTERKSSEGQDCALTLVRLTSQTWRGSPWNHGLLIAVPAKIERRDSAVLVISGGSNKPGFEDRMLEDAAMLVQIAKATSSAAAILGQVPNQPLFGGLKEDEAIAHTFEQYLKTGEADWPLLFPMTKAAVKAMDAVADCLGRKHGLKIGRFFVAGASKRGWTTWLTAAVDSRVAAISPMVIDMLNLQEHLEHQIASWGAYSESIDDYSVLNLPEKFREGRGAQLVKFVDPYVRRASLRMPKLIVLGTNDPYWPVDSAGLYFPGLEGPKFLHYVPNAGHGLNMTVLQTLAGFHNAVMSGSPLPSIEWKFSNDGGRISVILKSEPPPERASLWIAKSRTRDFRKAVWEVAITEEGGRKEYALTAEGAREDQGFIALFASLAFKDPRGLSFSLCTEVKIWSLAGKEKPIPEKD